MSFQQVRLGEGQRAQQLGSSVETVAARTPAKATRAVPVSDYSAELSRRRRRRRRVAPCWSASDSRPPVVPRGEAPATAARGQSQGLPPVQVCAALNVVLLLANDPPPLSPCRQQVLYGTLPKGANRGPIPEETEADGPTGDLTESRRGSRASGGGVSVIGQSGGGATSGQVQGGQLRRSQDGRISLR